jgi:hypothetical protein
MIAATTATPVIARIDAGKDGGYLTRKGADNYALSYGANRTDHTGGVIVIDERVNEAGRKIFVPVHVHTITDGPATTPCADCGEIVDTRRVGFGYRDENNVCPKGRPMYPGHRVDYTAFDACKRYDSAVALVGTDARYTFQAV